MGFDMEVVVEHRGPPNPYGGEKGRPSESSTARSFCFCQIEGVKPGGVGYILFLFFLLGFDWYCQDVGPAS